MELVIDPSALMALLLQEAEAESLLEVAAEASVVHLSAASRSAWFPRVRAMELRIVRSNSCSSP